MSDEKRSRIVKERVASVRRRQMQRVILFLIMLLLMSGLAVFSAYRHYMTYPATVETDTVTVADKGLDYIELSWDPPRNAEVYHVFYCKRGSADEWVEDEDTSADEETVAKWEKAESDSTGIKIEGLEEGMIYSFVIRGDNEDYQGHYSDIRSFATKKHQTISIDDKMIKLTGSDPFMIDATAETSMSFESSDSKVIKVDHDTGRATVTGEGQAVITVKAEETDQFETDEKKIEITVYDAYPVDIKGSQARIMYRLSPANCEAILRVRGAGGADIPQSMGYTGKRYYIAFGMYGPTRIVRYNTDGTGRTVIKPKTSLGHPNGATYEPERKLFYCLKGRDMAFAVYDIRNKEFLNGRFDHGCSGIAYDRVRRQLYTTSKTSIVQFDPYDYSRVRKTGVVAHKRYMSRQDCECYDGILMHCVSTGSDKHGINYIDLYDVRHNKYIGSLMCRLSEVESAIVNDDGFLEILTTGNGKANYIWRTDINIRLLAKEFH